MSVYNEVCYCHCSLCNCIARGGVFVAFPLPKEKEGAQPCGNECGGGPSAGMAQDVVHDVGMQAGCLVAGNPIMPICHVVNHENGHGKRKEAEAQSSYQ